MNQNSQTQITQSPVAFTLVELIVVITILAILGTIGFISIQGYSSKSRDSVRVTALNNAITALEVAQTRTGRYPAPDNSFRVTYSGATVWTQGLMGSGVLTQLSNDGMTQAPTDPLTRTQYGYSVLAFGPMAHQIRIEYEGDLVANVPRHIFTADTAYAESGNPTIVGIKGSYGGRFMAQTQTGGLVYVLAIPSIVTNTGALGGPALDIGADTLSGTLLMNASSRVGGIAYNPNKLVYTGVSLPLDDSTGQVTTLFANLRTAYSGTVLQANRAISPIYTLTATDTPVAGPVIINNQLGKGVSLGVVASSSNNFCTAGGTIPCIIGP